MIWQMDRLTNDDKYYSRSTFGSIGPVGAVLIGAWPIRRRRIRVPISRASNIKIEVETPKRGKVNWRTAIRFFRFRLESNLDDYEIGVKYFLTLLMTSLVCFCCR